MTLTDLCQKTQKFLAAMPGVWPPRHQTHSHLATIVILVRQENSFSRREQPDFSADEVHRLEARFGEESRDVVSEIGLGLHLLKCFSESGDKFGADVDFRDAVFDRFADGIVGNSGAAVEDEGN